MDNEYNLSATKSMVVDDTNEVDVNTKAVLAVLKAIKGEYHTNSDIKTICYSAYVYSQPQGSIERKFGEVVLSQVNWDYIYDQYKEKMNVNRDPLSI